MSHTSLWEGNKSSRALIHMPRYFKYIYSHFPHLMPFPSIPSLSRGGHTHSIAHAAHGHPLVQISLAPFHPGSFEKKNKKINLSRLYQRLHQIPIVLGAPHNPNGFKRKLLPADSRSGCQLPDVWLLLSVTGIIFAQKWKWFWSCRTRCAAHQFIAKGLF